MDVAVTQSMNPKPEREATQMRKIAGDKLQRRSSGSCSRNGGDAMGTTEIGEDGAYFTYVYDTQKVEVRSD